MTKNFFARALALLLPITLGTTYFTVDRTVPDWLFNFWSVTGTNFSILGILYTIIQIHLLRTEFDIIKAAALQTRDNITIVNQYGDIATAIKLIQEIQGYVRMRKHEASVMRLQELKILIGQMNLMELVLRRPFDRSATIFRLNQVINTMENDIADRTSLTQAAAVNASLENILDALVEIQQQTVQRSSLWTNA